MLKFLLSQFVKRTGRNPNNLEMILLKQQASKKAVDERKIVSMFDRSPVDANKPILGGKNIIETDEQMIQRFKNQNKEAVESLRKNKGSINSLKEALMKTDNPFSDLVKTTKKGPKSLEQRRKEAEEALRNKNVVPIKDPKDPQKFYQGGQAQIEPDLSGIGHGSDALMARNMLIAPGSQATTSTGLNYLLGEDNDTTRVPYKEKGSVTLADLIKVQGSGSISGKNQIQGAPKDITSNESFINLIVNLDIPISEKINLLGSYGYGKDRFKVEKDNKELFLGEGGYKDRNIGIGFNQGGEGLSGSVIRNLETGDNDYQLKLLKKFAEGGRTGYKDAGPVVLPQPKPAADPMVELQRIYDLYKKSMPGVSQETQKYLQQDFIQKLNEANISQEQFMTNQMQTNFAEGGRIGYANGSPNPLMPMPRQQMLRNALNQPNFGPRLFNQKAPPTEYSKMMDKQSVYTPFNSGRIKDEFDEKTQQAFTEGSAIAMDTPSDFTKDSFDKQGYSSDMRHGLGSSAFKDAAMDYITSNTPLKPHSVLANDLGIFAANAGSLFTEIPDMFSQAKAVAESKGPYAGIDDYGDELDTRFLTQPIEDIKANYVGSQIPFSLRNNLEGKKYFIDNYYKYGSNTMNQLKLDADKNKVMADKMDALREKAMRDARQTQTTASAQQNRDSGTGGYQSSFGQDTGFMGGSGTAAEMGSFAEGGPARQNFGMGKRAFLKLIGSGVAGIAGIKTGLLGFGKKEVAKSVIAPATQAANEAAPAYFLKLVAKIKKLGDDVTETGALAERQNVKQYKDFTLTEDTTTGRIEIQKVKTDAGEEFGKDNFGNGLTEEVYMGYRPPETIVVKGKSIKTKPEYEEGTAYLRNDGPNTGDVYEEVSGVTDEVLKEVGESLIKKAEGGRIGYKLGKKVVETVIKKAGEGKFTKNEVLLNMFQNTIKGTKDANTKTKFTNFIEEIKLKPELSKDPNVWNFFTKGLPKNQKLVVYGDDTVDFWTQSDFGPHNIATSAKFQKKHPYLTKDQAVKIQNMEPEDQIFEMKRLEAIRKRTANASGGRIGFSAGKGIMAIVKNLLKPKAKLSYADKFPRIDIKELMKGDKPIKLYSGVGDRQANTLKAYKETAKDFGVTPEIVAKDNYKGQWFTPFKEYASSFGNPRNIKSKMLTTELTPKEIKMALRYVEKINKTNYLAHPHLPTKKPRYPVTTDENTVLIPKIKLKKLKKAGKIDTDYMILEKMKKKLGLAEGGLAGMLGE